MARKQLFFYQKFFRVKIDLAEKTIDKKNLDNKKMQITKKYLYREEIIKDIIEISKKDNNLPSFENFCKNYKFL